MSTIILYSNASPNILLRFWTVNIDDFRDIHHVSNFMFSYQDNGYNGNYQSNNDSLAYDNGGSYNQGYGPKDNYRQAASGDYGKYNIHASGIGTMNLFP